MLFYPDLARVGSDISSASNSDRQLHQPAYLVESIIGAKSVTLGPSFHCTFFSHTTALGFDDAKAALPHPATGG